MSYSDMINLVNQYGTDMKSYYANTANNLQNVKFKTGPVNPNSSGAFTPQSARNIYSSATEVYNPMAAFSDYKPYKGENLAMQGMKGLQYLNLAGEVTPYVKDFASSLFKPTPTHGYGYGTGKGPNFALPAAVYGLTQDQDPYHYTKTEALGSTVGNLMMGHQLSTMLPAGSILAGGAGATAAGGATLAGMSAVPAGSVLANVNPYVAAGVLLYSLFCNKRKRKQAKSNVAEAIKGVEDKQSEIYDTRADLVKEGREEMLAQQATDMYRQRQSRYDNQYGGAYGVYNAEEGMKMDKDIVAEFTGNELIVNEQDKVEKALANKNYSKAASYIKKAMKGGKITPGPETHQGNPMPVDSEGNIYAGGGILPFKAIKGSGIYDHATDQFKPTMTDKEIAMVAQENINKWESNGMA